MGKEDEQPERQNRTIYWYNRLRENSHQLGAEQKMVLTRLLLEKGFGLSTAEVEIFTSPIALTDAKELEETLHYSMVEKKLARFFSSCLDDEADKVTEKRRQEFSTGFRAILTNFYTSAELDEMISLMGKTDEVYGSDKVYVLMWLLGEEHFIVRRIRNAYLPAITSAVQIGKGDISHTLFDGKEDAVDAIMKEFRNRR